MHSLSQSRSTCRGISGIAVLIVIIVVFIGAIVAYTIFFPSPVVGISNVTWQSTGGFLNSHQKNTIGSTDSTSFSFQVKNLSDNETRIVAGLSAQANVSPITSTISISPSSQPVPSLAYQGKSSPVTFNVYSNNAPNGKYNIKISVLVDGNVTTSQTIVLTVG